MSAIQYDPRDDQWADDEAQDTLISPRRPPRRRLDRGGGVLVALLVGAIGFYVGVRVEKGQIGGSSTAAAVSLPSGGSSGFARAPGAGSLTRFPGAGGGGTIGTLASVDGRTIYVKTVSGNTARVKLVSATRVSKSIPVGRTSLRPGDSVIVQGVSGSNGTVTATSVSDTGASSSGSGGSAPTASAGSTSSGPGSGSSSLFGNPSGG